MRILILTHAFNSLSQRLHMALTAEGHELAVELDINDRTTIEAVELFRPQLVLAPFLKRRIPERIFVQTPCLIVHPGPPGDQGPAALDWAILQGHERWGVTVLQAEAQLDAGPVRSWREFGMRPARKSSLYRFEVTEAAVEAVLEAVKRFEHGGCEIETIRRPGQWRGAVPADARRIEWQADDTETVLRKIHSADGHPGVRDAIAGLPCRLFDAHAEATLAGRPGHLLARRGDAVCRATRDGAVWIGRLRGEDAGSFKLPATTFLGDRIGALPESTLSWADTPGRSTYQPLRYRERGEIGYLHFDFYNGAMGTRDCRDLLAAFDHARSQPTRVIVLAGGSDFWSNGLDLNRIEASDSPADESWRNIEAMDDLCRAIITTTSHLIVAALGGNAGAGGVFLALGADRVIARDGVVLNPHYKNMGNLYGSEYWTYLLPRRAGRGNAEAILARRLPLGVEEARQLGLVDTAAPNDFVGFERAVSAAAAQLAGDAAYLLREKSERLARDAAEKPLDAYREEELERMRLNFYGFDPSYHVARYRFVHRTPHAWTPLYLAPHRRLGWQVPSDTPAESTA